MDPKPLAWGDAGYRNGSNIGWSESEGCSQHCSDESAENCDYGLPDDLRFGTASVAGDDMMRVAVEVSQKRARGREQSDSRKPREEALAALFFRLSLNRSTRAQVGFGSGEIK